ncbi:conserved hypothetical protein [Talaromyces stipitatus ATCC 10500]|uniref:BTB domain-containing protein n=1 Tax=Talaromyces stipitatus (strain ATCC 10500 / CBS 375.48 / QM 6759 / NRRL 1006) TaxID=441959 RepID=B8MUX5_TALSN|nr:uncharacterized protein TSTA_109220 [Talaromyces stipitatus ATCC 10500]EED11743.1 conserved hypothetical protein [Talaromyces stipitatus ATCC 10500]
MSQQAVGQTLTSDQWALRVLTRIRELREFSDLTIVCEGVKYEVHKAIICSQSPVLHAACTGGFQANESSPIVDRFVQFLYTGDYTISEKDHEGVDLSPMQYHARVFALADKYDVKTLCDLAANKYYDRLKNDFDYVEFLDSIPDVYQRTLPQSRLRILAVRFSRERIEDALRDNSNLEKYDNIASQVPAFTKDLLDSYITCPILADCEKCGPDQPMRALQARCRKCDYVSRSKIPQMGMHNQIGSQVPSRDADTLFAGSKPIISTGRVENAFTVTDLDPP